MAERKYRYRLFYWRVSAALVLIILQAVSLSLVLLFFNRSFRYFWALCIILSIAEVLAIVNKDMNPAFKLALVVPILLFPVFGGLFYFLLARRKPKKNRPGQLYYSREAMPPQLKQDKDIMRSISETDESVASQIRYISEYGHFPAYKNTAAEYLSPGEVFFRRLKEKLLSAEKFIFMEYFAIHEGVMWNEVLDILAGKAKAGLDVRVIYDDVGCVRVLPGHYNKHLEKMGIRCRVYNPFKPVLSAGVNNRDHRKITIIDGNVAFTGGINLADEYINKYDKIGYWKDASVMVEGEAVKSFTYMFLSLWDMLGPRRSLPEHPADDYGKFLGTAAYPASDGIIVPYGDIPTDDETVGENVYMNLIAKAKKYIYVCTPYFIVDYETLRVLCLASKCGVDVRIVTPYIPDKWYIHTITKSHYRKLIENGIRVYEYTPGFMHSKTIVCDHDIGITGSINFDYRSLYFHFECAVYMYRSGAVRQMEQDFLEILKVSRQITLDECRDIKPITKIARAVLRIFSPLM